MTAHRTGDIELEVVHAPVARAHVPRRPAPPAAPWLFAAAMAASASVAVLGGLVLGFLAATETAFGENHWTEAVQAHGRLQLVGWTAVFVASLAFEFIVRLNQRGPLPFLPRLLVLCGLGTGALLEAVAQVWNDPLGFAWLPGAAITFAASAGFATLIWRVRAAFPFRLDLQPVFFRIGATWLAVAGAVSLLAVLRADDGVVRVGDAHLAVELIARGFVLNTILGVALRAFPGHLGLEPLPVRRQANVMGILNGALLAWAAGSGAFGLPDEAVVRSFANVALAVGLVLFTIWMGVLSPLRNPAGGPNYRVLVPLAWLGLVAYALALAGTAVAEFDSDLGLYQDGAVRHIFLLGFMAPLMAAMAHIVLARFGTGRVRWEPLLTASFAGLMLAWPLRVLPVLFTNNPGTMGRSILGTAAVIAAASLAAMAVVAGRNALAIRELVKEINRSRA
ncbi:MAG: hypothetical protein HUU14_05315 [Dehalococcoidia bacterium]|nr:hypothetical protein [Chloroflexi bacterium CFX7]NUQ55287.1 hypothetical protein [Dehalococcoidia bacterium]RIL04163.1 MAG: hypothetical protein DCC78_00830 [bacterium]